MNNQENDAQDKKDICNLKEHFRKPLFEQSKECQ